MLPIIFYNLVQQVVAGVVGRATRGREVGPGGVVEENPDTFDRSSSPLPPGEQYCSARGLSEAVEAIRGCGIASAGLGA
jgi:hypothetical protein